MLRLDENLRSAAISLSANDLKEINEAVSMIEVQGTRYPEQMQKMVGR
jgi:hypothetical protein